MSDSEKQFVADLSDEQLEALGLFGSGAVEQVKKLVEIVRKVPKRILITSYSGLTVPHLQCLAVHRPHKGVSPSLFASSEGTARSYQSDSSAAEPEFVSPFERVHFYTGLSDNPPELFQRSDVLTRPFVVPKERHSVIPDKTAHGVVHQVLTPVFWRSTVGPEIVALLKDKERGLDVSSMVPARFSIPDDNGKPVFDHHIVIWISVHPDSTTEAACRDANPGILAILEKHGVKDAAVHWIEGTVEPLVGPAMMGVGVDSDPTTYIRRAMMGVMGVSLAAEEMADIDTQGTLGIYFHQGEKLFAVTNKHVVSRATNTDYKFGRVGAPKKYIRCCGDRRLKQVQEETNALISSKLEDITLLTTQIIKPTAESQSTDKKEIARDRKRKELELEWLNEDIQILDDFRDLINSTWCNANRRSIGWVDWAPMIRNNIDQRCYTRDIAVIELDKSKWQEAFKGNHVYLRGKFTHTDIKEKFYPNIANPPSFKYPDDHLFKIQGCVTAEGLSSPYFLDEDNKPCFIVGKVGQTTDLTFGRFSELEAYKCDEFKNDSWEVAVYNFDREVGNFSAKGDSGACIFNAEGKMVAILHSGMTRGLFVHNHVTFGTPAHYVIDQIKAQYPNADFSRNKI